MMLLVATLCLTVVTVSAATSPTVTIGSTTFKGNLKEHVDEFLGIKYATAARLQDPVKLPVSSLPNSVSAQAAGDMCIQHCSVFPSFTCVPNQSEDCLFLNIYRPRGLTSSSKVCVIFFMHGGNYQEGSGGGSVFDGYRLSDPKIGGCVFVTINYRMGVLGFLGGRNLGLKDQMAAFDWVVKNIQHFGGDPAKITVMGQSAGCLSAVLLQDSSFIGSQHIKRAVLLSCPFSIPFRTQAEAIFQENNFKKATGCDIAPDLDACYNALSTSVILQKQHDRSVSTFSQTGFGRFIPWGPTIDGVLVRDHPFNMYKKNLLRRVETIIGTTTAEGNPYVGFNPITINELNNILSGIKPFVNTNTISPFYKINTVSPELTLSEIATDFIFRCPARNIALQLSKKVTNVYRYQFNENLPISGNLCDPLACHGLDVPFWTGTVANVSKIPSFPAVPGLQQKISLSTLMMKYLTNFANTGKPNTQTSVRVLWFKKPVFSPPVEWKRSYVSIINIKFSNSLILSADDPLRQFDFFYEKEFGRCGIMDLLNTYNP